MHIDHLQNILKNATYISGFYVDTCQPQLLVASERPSIFAGAW